MYVSGTSRVRDDEELAGCSNDSPFENPESALFRIEVIEIPMDRPQDSKIVNRPFIFSDPETGVLAGLWEGEIMGLRLKARERQINVMILQLFLKSGSLQGMLWKWNFDGYF